MILRSPSYLLRVGTRYHFRFRFPKKSCNYLSGEIRLSLMTGSLRKARLLAGMLANETKKFIEGEGINMSVTKKKIRAALAAYLRASLELNDDSRFKGVEPYQFVDKASKQSTFSSQDLLTLNSIALKDELSGKESYSQYGDR